MIKKYTHIIYPCVSGLIFLVLSILQRNLILKTFTIVNIQEIIFSYSSTILGFALATYGIFMSLSPNLDKNIRKSETMQSINNYFFIFLMIMILQLIFSVIFLFNSNYYLFLILSAIFGISTIMILYITKGIRSLYNLIITD